MVMNWHIRWRSVTLDIRTEIRRRYGIGNLLSANLAVSVGLPAGLFKRKGRLLAPDVHSWLWESHHSILKEFPHLAPLLIPLPHNRRPWRRLWRIARLERMDYLYSLSL